MYRSEWLVFSTVLLLGACASQPGAPSPSPPSPPDPTPGQGSCLQNGTWDFGDPADPANHRKFLDHAETVNYLTVASGQAQLPVIPPGFGGVPGPPIPGAVSGRIDPRQGINDSDRSAYVAGSGPCPGRVIARVHIDGTQSTHPAIRERARRALQERRNARGQVLPDRLALLGGYKTELHQHGDYDNPPGVEHAHRYFPEGTSYVWMDRLTEQNGVWVARGVIVSEDTAVAPWPVRIRYCPHEGSTDPHCAPAHPVPPSQPLARWLDIPEDDHAWEWCSLMGCCIVESNTFLR